MMFQILSFYNCFVPSYSTCVFNIIITMGDEKALRLSVSFDDLMFRESESQKVS